MFDHGESAAVDLPGVSCRCDQMLVRLGEHGGGGGGGRGGLGVCGSHQVLQELRESQTIIRSFPVSCMTEAERGKGRNHW